MNANSYLHTCNIDSWFILISARCHFKTCHPLTLPGDVAITVAVALVGTAHTL